MADTNEEVSAVTGRPNDTPVRDPEPAPLGGNSSFASRAKERSSSNRKAVDADDAENKAVGRSERKSNKAR